MSADDILKRRLHNTGLSNQRFSNPEEVVSHLGAVQAQDFAAAKWALGMRIKNAADSDIEQAFNEGKILRTHVLRPTWHFVMPADIRWMLELTAPRVKRFMGHYNRKLELDDQLFKKSNALIVKVIRDTKYVTRQELKKELEKIGITTDVQRLAHIIMWAELDQLICSGPRRGKQFTYALLDERTPKEMKVSREEALSTLALLYFTSHGPAQLKDFSWWSGLSKKEAEEGIEGIRGKLHKEEVSQGKIYWYSSNSEINTYQIPKALLLSIYDEYTIAYTDRSDLSESPRDIEKIISMGNALTAVMILSGKVCGTWKRTVKRDRVEVKLSPFRSLKKDETEAFEREVKRYGKFLGLKGGFSISSNNTIPGSELVEG